jgi:hypothetical protein
MISDIFRGEYPLPARFKKTLYSEYWLPSTELARDPSLWVMVERRVHEELERYYRQIESRDLPEFDPSLIRGRWFSYDWDKRSFSGAPPDVPPPEEYMRG